MTYWAAFAAKKDLNKLSPPKIGGLSAKTFIDSHLRIFTNQTAHPIISSQNIVYIGVKIE